MTMTFLAFGAGRPVQAAASPVTAATASAARRAFLVSLILYTFLS
jgi:hypothetical protein